MSRRRFVSCAVTVVLALGFSGAGVAPGSGIPATMFHPGSADLGDYLVPGLGNGGYDVEHYGIDLAFDDGSGLLSGSTTITARLTDNLSQFDLDFVLPVRSVTVNGEPASFKLVNPPGFQLGNELVVTPKSGLREGSTMTVVVRYAAKPHDVKFEGFSEWSSTQTGWTVWDEPSPATEWWYPSNAYPSDKATFDVSITTDSADQAISNGLLVSRTVHGDLATSHWRSTAPMSTYLSFLSIGKYDIVRGKLDDGTPTLFAYEKTGDVYVQRARRDVSRAPDILNTLARWWGPYPFPVAGAIVNETRYGTAFESQTRPTYTALYWKNHPRNVWAVVHELSHQWYGDDVTMARWRHIWLAEGFATYNEWMWSQAHGNGTAEQLFESEYSAYPKANSFWKDPVIHPQLVLAQQAYERGAMTLQALRNLVGSKDFFTIMRQWVRLHHWGNGASVQFADLASKVSGRDLTRFFDVWLSSAHRPAPLPRNGFPQGFHAGQVAPPPSFNAIRRTDSSLSAPMQ